MVVTGCLIINLSHTFKRKLKSFKSSQNIIPKLLMLTVPYCNKKNHWCKKFQELVEMSYYGCFSTHFQRCKKMLNVFILLKQQAKTNIFSFTFLQFSFTKFWHAIFNFIFTPFTKCVFYCAEIEKLVFRLTHLTVFPVHIVILLFYVHH